jgi:hypothetical protein
MLAIGIHVDHDVGAHLQRGFGPGPQCRAGAQVDAMAHHNGARLAGHGGCGIG